MAIAIAAVPLAAAEVGAAGAATASALATTFSLSTIFTGASLAWSIGSTLFSLMSGSSGITSAGPRMADLHPQSAAFGASIKRFWWTDRMAGELIWIGSDGNGGRGIREHAKKIKAGGKGKGGGAATIIYTYDADFAISINGASNCKGVLRIWEGTKLIYDVRRDRDLWTRVATGVNLIGNVGTVTFYDGNEDQEPPPAIAALAGVDNCSAYRNQFLAVFENYELTSPIPHFSFECFTDGEPGYDEVGFYNINYGPPGVYPWFTGTSASWSYVDPNGEIYVLVNVNTTNYDSVFETGDMAGQHVFQFFHLLPDGSITREERPGSWMAGGLALGHADAPFFISASGGINYLTSLEDNTTTAIQPPISQGADWAAGDFGISQISLWHIKGDTVYTIYNAGFVGDPHICTFSLTGVLLQSSEVINAWSGYRQPIDFMVGENYLWALSLGNGASGTHDLLYKIDRDLLTMVEVIDLGISGKLYNLYVETDDLIKFVGPVASGIGFYEFRPSLDAKPSLLGSALTPHGPGYGNLYIRNGLWYTGSDAFGIFDVNIHVWAPGAASRCGPLGIPVRDVCISAGLDEDEIDVSELTECLDGYTLDQQMSARDAIIPLQRFGFFDGRESDLMLEFPLRGHSPVETIPEADMAARPGVDADLPAVMAQTRGQETEMPIRVHVRYKDIDADYQTGHAYASRLTTESQHTVTVDLAIAMPASKARQIANVLLATYYLERSPKEIHLSRRHLPLDAADPVLLELVA